MKLLFVCTGNTCRSPLMEAFTSRLLARDNKWQVKSAGLAAYGKAPATTQARQVAGEYGLDISSHRSSLITEEELSEADLILAMTARQSETLKQIFPGKSNRIHTIKEFLGLQGEVDDPFSGGLNDYRTTAKELCELAELLREKLLLYQEKSDREDS